MPSVTIAVTIFNNQFGLYFCSFLRFRWCDSSAKYINCGKTIVGYLLFKRYQFGITVCRTDCSKLSFNLFKRIHTLLVFCLQLCQLSFVSVFYHGAS